MNRPALAIAVLLAVAMTIVHVVIGGQMIAEPLLQSDLATLPRMTLYLCWHGVTIVLAGMAVLFAMGLRGRRDAVKLAGGLAAAFFLLGWSYIVGFGLSPLDLPQWIAFGPMTLAAWVALKL